MDMNILSAAVVAVVLLYIFFRPYIPAALRGLRLILPIVWAAYVLRLFVVLPVMMWIALAVLVAASFLVRRRRNYSIWISFRNFIESFVLLRTFRPSLFFSKGFLLVALDALLSGAAVQMAVFSVRSGVSVSDLAIICLLLALSMTHLYFIIFKGDIMDQKPFDYLDLVTDRERLEAFFAEEERQKHVIKIDPDKLIPLLKNEVIGQDHVIDEVVATLARRVRIQRKNKPLGVFLFAGATGSGKTELAKQIAKHVFNGRMARFDMNEFNVKYSITRLTGSAPGYVDSEKGGQLTQEIKKLRTGVILFDEIEKCAPEVYNAIMTLLDEGRITEQSTGEVMDATGFVIIMTTNAKHKDIVDLLDNTPDEVERRRAVRDTLMQVFKPEQLARIDEIFAFNKLARRDLSRIILKFVRQFALDARVELAAVDSELILKMLEDQVKIESYGIRELVRLIENRVVDGMIMCRDNGFPKVNVSVQSGEIVVSGVR